MARSPPTLGVGREGGAAGEAEMQEQEGGVGDLRQRTLAVFKKLAPGKGEVGSMAERGGLESLPMPGLL